MQFLATLGSQAIETRLALVFGEAVFRNEEAALQKPLQGGIERTVADLQHLVGLLFYRVSNGMAVCRTKQQRPQDQQVQRSLE